MGKMMNTLKQDLKKARELWFQTQAAVSFSRKLKSKTGANC